MSDQLLFTASMSRDLADISKARQKEINAARKKASEDKFENRINEVLIK